MSRFLLVAMYVLVIGCARASISNFASVNNTSGCSPLTLQASASENSSAPLTGRRWILTTCNGDTVTSTIYSLNNTFTFILNAFDSCECFRLTLISKNQDGDSAIFVAPLVRVFSAPKVTPLLTTDCSQPPVLKLKPGITPGCGMIDTVTIDWGCGAIDVLHGNLDSVNYTAACPDGCYNITIEATDTNGCKTSRVMSNAYCLPGNAQIPVGYVSQNELACPNPPTVIQYFDTTSGGLVSAVWHFGDGDSSMLDTSTHVYTKPGAYEVTLTRVNLQGCTATATINSIVVRGPTADVTVSPTELCMCADSAHFVLHTTGVATIAWTMGCNQGFGTDTIMPVGTIDTPTVVEYTWAYCVTGLCVPQFLLSDSLGCTVALQEEVYVDTPAVNFVYGASSSCSNGPTCFTDSTIYLFGDTTVYGEHASFSASYAWDFGDSTAIDTTRNPCHVYTSSGTYTVKLSVVSNAGCERTIQKQVSIRPGPSASFTYNISDTSCNVASVCFTNTSQTAPGADTLTKVWNLGPGTSPPILNNILCYGYLQEGNYNVLLRVTDKFGCWDTVSQPISINIHFLKTQIKITSTNDSCYSSLVCVNDSSASEGGNVTQRLWTVAGQAVQVGVPDTCFTLFTKGQQTLRFKVTDNTGCNTETTVVANARFNHPIAGFTYLINGNSVAFMDTSNGQVDTVIWNFGNGVVVGGENTTQTLQYDSTYNITQVVIDGSSGCSDTATLILTMPSDTTTDTVGIGAGLVEKVGIAVAPNPFNSYTSVTITGAKAAVVLQVTNLLGEPVTGAISRGNGTHTIACEDLPPGVYVLLARQGSALVGKYKLLIR